MVNVKVSQDKTMFELGACIWDRLYCCTRNRKKKHLLERIKTKMMTEEM